MFRRLSFQPYIIKKGIPPELPKTKEELDELISKTKCRLIVRSRQTSERFGTTSECSILLKYPFCESEFTGHESSGCFHHHITPMMCPVCNFPHNILKQYRKYGGIWSVS